MSIWQIVSRIVLFMIENSIKYTSRMRSLIANFNLHNIGNSVDGKSHYTHAATLSGKGV